MVPMDAADPGRGERARSARSAARRRHRDRHLARPGRHALRLGARGDPAARDPAHRRREPRAARRPRRGDPHRATGYFQCDCRGAGTDWQVEEIRRISTGAARHRRHHPGARPDAGAVPGDDARLDGARRRRRPAAGVDAAGRAGAVRAAGVARRSRTSPPVVSRSTRSPAATRPGPGPTSPATTTSASGSPAKAIGQEQLAARVQLAIGDDVVAQGLVKATWSNNSELTARIDQQVAHYTGQTELAAMIQEGLAAKAVRRRRHRDHQARPGRPARRRDRQRRGHLQAAQGGRHRRREGRHRPAQGGGRQGRRDGARHRLDQDHPDQEVSDLPGRTRVRGHRLLRRLRDRDGSPTRRRLHRRRTPRPTPRPHPRARLPELPGGQPAERAVLRGLRLRLHDRLDAAAGRAADRRAPRPASALTANTVAAARRGVGGRGLDRPRLVRRPESPPTRSRRRACPHVVPLKNTSMLIGRASRSRNITPDIDLSSDNGISRRHAQLTTDGTPLVGRGPRLLQRHLRRRHRRRAARRPRSRPARSRRSRPTTGSTSAPGPGSWSGRRLRARWSEGWRRGCGPRRGNSQGI